MFRSDDLYREMNYMIENLSPLLLNNLIFAVTSLQYINSSSGGNLEDVKFLHHPIKDLSKDNFILLGDSLTEKFNNIYY